MNTAVFELTRLFECSQFGPKVVKPQPIVKALPSLFDAKQEQIRDSVKKLAVRLRGRLAQRVVETIPCTVPSPSGAAKWSSGWRWSAKCEVHGRLKVAASCR